MAKKSRRPVEAVAGSYTPTPHRMLDSQAYIGCSSRAKALLLELMRQHTGSNNGHLHLSNDWLARRGWTSRDQIAKAKAELIKRGLIVQTRQGGLRIGPSRFALTWLSISNFAGLDITQSQYHPGAWSLLDAPPTVKKCDDRTAVRYSAVPQHGTEDRRPVPQGGTKNPLSSDFPVPPCGNNEVYHSPPGVSAVVPDTGTAPWATSDLARLDSLGLAGRQCYIIPTTRTQQ